MGTIAARDAVRVIELTRQVLASALLASVQALHVRLKQGALAPERLEGVEKTYHEVLGLYEPLTEDRALDKDLRKTVALIGERFFTV